ncbi:MAG: Ig-like domain-containing protein [Clostridia bacterium]
MKNNLKRFFVTFALILAALMTLSTAAFAQDVVTLQAEPEHMLIAVGKVGSLKLSIEPYAARKAGCVYQSSNEAIAKVDTHGKVKGIAAGECEITITSKKDESVKLTLPVSVVIPVRKLKAEVSQTTLHVGETTAITCTYEPAQATLQQATYHSGQEKVATVSAEGVITAVARGQADIAVHSLDGSAKAQLRIKVLQQPTSVTITPEALQLPTGKISTLKATVLPANADKKAVTWSTSDESTVTVDRNGRVKCLKTGIATITATCVDDTSVSASIKVEGVQLAKAAAFQSKTYGVILGQTIQLGVNVTPEDTTNKAVTYKVKNPKIATVDENGLLTGIKGGKTVVTATTADGSKRSGTTTVQVIVPVTGVSFKQSNVRVGAGYHGTFQANIEPKDATDRRMTWVSSDESIAGVRGDHDRVRIIGRRWGRCQIKGTTADGGFTCTVMANIGALSKAVVVNTVEVRDGAPYIVLQNKSNLNITSVSYEITGTDWKFQPVRMSEKGETLYGVYEHPLSPGAKTRHGEFRFYHRTNYPNLAGIQIAVTGWQTDTGFYGSDGEIYYKHTIPHNKLDWVSWNPPGLLASKVSLPVRK